jgi:hypothetical protein
LGLLEQLIQRGYLLYRKKILQRWLFVNLFHPNYAATSCVQSKYIHLKSSNKSILKIMAYNRNTTILKVLYLV